MAVICLSPAPVDDQRWSVPTLWPECFKLSVDLQVRAAGPGEGLLLFHDISESNAPTRARRGPCPERVAHGE